MTSVSSPGTRTITFRDPAGSVIRSGGRVLRSVNESGKASLSSFLRSQTAIDLLLSGRLVDTKEIAPKAAPDGLLPHVGNLKAEGGALYEHSPVWFPSYPYEWPAEMLYAAAELTLDIAEASLKDGFGLKDATPFNVLFDRGRPVFVDVCSFEERRAGDPLWLPCSQFERTFLLPLLAGRCFHVDPCEVFLANLDGLDPDRIRHWFHFPQVLKPAVCRMVLIPHLLNRLAESTLVSRSVDYSSKIDEKGARRLLESLMRTLRAKLESVKPELRQSDWSGYDPDREDVDAKSELVTRVLNETRPWTVLDVGCNTGTYSRIAAKCGARVVAVDSDSTVAGRVWRGASADKLDILPLVANFARPVPGMGWRNSEYLSFEERARGQFDAVFMLAVIHHIVVRDRIPLEQVFETVAGYTRRTLIIEFVANDDPMFRKISRGRDSLFKNHTEKRFLEAALPWFEVQERRPLPSGTRCLFVMSRHRS